MKLLIVIVNYRVTDLTVDCLKSLEPEIDSVPDAHIALCENGTGPEAVEQLEKVITSHGWERWCTLTAIHPNRGFTGGNNAVIGPALKSDDPPDYVYLLNADTIVRPNALRTMVEFMDAHPLAGMAGSRLESVEGVPRSTAFRFFNIASEFDSGLRLGIVSRLLRRRLGPDPLSAEPARVEWTSGAALCLRRALLEEIGLLDEDLYTYFDDIDICLRARRAGWEAWLVPDSRIVHLMGRSTGVTQRDTKPNRRPAYWFQARRHFFLKHYGALYTALCDAAFILGFGIWRVRRWIQRKCDHDPPCLLGDFIRHSVLTTGFRLRPVRNPAMIPPESGGV
jgi:hypothetical protein